ncbi:hypothetical protein AC579_800 [Pseudocercospora musae]|uniref:Uncharacterized protein n=1 Tax=Pseudocercospora musae TaxID=113226 RepID=A0A139IH07_9PEZI|nr:hypothetical protein AC579_800 [Pseudocercospora musae]
MRCVHALSLTAGTCDHKLQDIRSQKRNNTRQSSLRDLSHPADIRTNFLEPMVPLNGNTVGMSGDLRPAGAVMSRREPKRDEVGELSSSQHLFVLWGRHRFPSGFSLTAATSQDAATPFGSKHESGSERQHDSLILIAQGICRTQLPDELLSKSKDELLTDCTEQTKPAPSQPM